MSDSITETERNGPARTDRDVPRTGSETTDDRIISASACCARPPSYWIRTRTSRQRPGTDYAVPSERLDLQHFAGYRVAGSGCLWSDLVQGLLRGGRVRVAVEYLSV
jgi:hypothetical protein